MKEKLKSKALEVNLEETRIREITIPSKHLKFIDLSQSHHGINKRAEECFKEFYHPLSNHKFVVDQIRKIALTDFWFYSSLDDSESAFIILIEIFEKLLYQDIDIKQNETIIRTLLEFTEKLSEQPSTYEKVIKQCFKIINENVENNQTCFAHCSIYFKKHLKNIEPIPAFSDIIFSITKKVLQKNIIFWKETSKIEQWYKDKKPLFYKDYSGLINRLGSGYFSDLITELNSAKTWNELVINIPSYNDIANQFRQLSRHFKEFIEKFYFTFYLLYLPGMKNLNDRLLSDINNLLKNVVGELKNDEVIDFLDKIFNMFEEFRIDHTSAVLDCISTLGKEIIKLDNSGDYIHVDYLERKIIDFGFETPGIVYVDNEWRTQVNRNHIKNIRVWIEIIESAPSIPEKLLSSLIINLHLGGVYISDTDLFQRDITKILNSNISPFLKKIKQLTHIFPVYFNEIGAEGEIRQVTTSMDEITHRNDKLIHFLRKQVHIEGNNTLIDLTRDIINFWYTADLKAIKTKFPKDVYESIDVKGKWFLPIHKMLNKLCTKNNCKPEDLLKYSNEELDLLLDDIQDDNEPDKKRLKYICRLYLLLKEKYSFESVYIISILENNTLFKNSEINDFKSFLKNEDYPKALNCIFEFIEKLNLLICNPKPSEAWENIYHKRHIAFGIPSMYGVYREKKFEALGLIFRLERVAVRMFEEIINSINLSYISATTLKRISAVLGKFKRGLELDGITSQGFNSNLQMLNYSLTSGSFSLGQYSNMFHFMADNIKKIINKYFIRSYEYPLNIIIPQLYLKNRKISENEKKKFILQKSEIFYREIIATGFLLQYLDNFIGRIIHTLHKMQDMFQPELLNEIMSYNSDLIISPLNQVTQRMDNQVFLGSKAYFLKKLYLLGFPVPPGFVITTEVFRKRHAIYRQRYLKHELFNKVKEQILQLEKTTNKTFGDPANPLILSVRSGTAISMPGAMATFLNIGLNDKTAFELSKKPGFGWAAWDSYRRLLQLWGMAHGINRDVFDHVIAKYKNKYGVSYKIGLSDEQMKNVTFAYKEILKKNNIHFEENPILQLTDAIILVFNSWSSKRAKVYREHLQISKEWGTAVIVQRMIFGNLNESSGTGVVFTQDPDQDMAGVNLFGDFTLSSQGEDIVSGLVHTLPISERQRKRLNLSKPSLQTLFPEIFKKLHSLALKMTEEHGFSHQEIEFTFESEKTEDLYILQTRDQNIKHSTNLDVFKTPKNKMVLLGHGIGIGGGAMNGILAFDMKDLQDFEKEYPDKNHILVRPDTVPDDIGMIFKCHGLITARGGVTSHAAVSAVQLGKVCIVNCPELFVNEKKKTCSINNNILKAGDEIAIEGHLGNIYRGHYAIKTTEIMFKI